jgi:hypothetical protein
VVDMPSIEDVVGFTTMLPQTSSAPNMRFPQNTGTTVANVLFNTLAHAWPIQILTQFADTLVKANVGRGIIIEAHCLQARGRNICRLAHVPLLHP